MPHNLAVSPYFGVSYPYRNSSIPILLYSSIDRPNYAGLFMNICVLFISVANKFSEKKNVLYDSLVNTKK